MVITLVGEYRYLVQKAKENNFKNPFEACAAIPQQIEKVEQLKTKE